MTLFLASVRDAAEAEIALRGGADIIDLKEPDRGALGAVDRLTSSAILSIVAGRVPTSATIGDLPMAPATIRAAVTERAASGVDYVKVGLFPEGDPQTCLAALQPLTRSVRVVVVLFADRLPVFDAVAAAAAIGASGVMLDTADKGAGSLLDCLSLGELASFVSRAKAHGLSAGLAGSLGAGHVPALLALEPDVLGFRGALCQGARNGTLDLQACLAMRALIPKATLAGRPKQAFNCRAAEALC